MTVLQPISAPRSRSRARAQQLLARVRRRQLELALSGRYGESARYALRARRVRRAADTALSR